MNDTPITTIEASPLSRRAKNILYRTGLSPEDAVYELDGVSRRDILRINGAGQKTLREIEAFMKTRGFKHKEEAQ